MGDKFEGEVRSLRELRTFLETAPSLFGPNDRIRRHKLPNSEVVSCVKWEEDFFISGTDIMRCIVIRFDVLGRNILNRARFEEFVFSDLRSLKTNVRVRLEAGKSKLLEFLHTNGCIRTKKKQRVFYWEAVPHDQLFLDSLERELRRAVIDDANNETHRITVAVREPALSMRYDPLMKVAHQIPKILSETSPEHLLIMSTLFGVAVPQTETKISECSSLAESGSSISETRHSGSSRSDSSRSLPAGSRALTCEPQDSSAMLRSPVLTRSSSVGADAVVAAYTKRNNEALNVPGQMPPTIPMEAWLPPPQMNNAPGTADVRLPSIQDALPPHAHLDIFTYPVLYRGGYSENMPANPSNRGTDSVHDTQPPDEQQQ